MAPGVEVPATYPGSTALGDPSTPPTGWGTGTGVASLYWHIGAWKI